MSPEKNVQLEALRDYFGGCSAEAACSAALIMLHDLEGRLASLRIFFSPRSEMPTEAQRMAILEQLRWKRPAEIAFQLLREHGGTD